MIFALALMGWTAVLTRAPQGASRVALGRAASDAMADPV